MTNKTPAQELREIASVMRLRSDSTAHDFHDAIERIADRIEREQEDAERFRAMVTFHAVFPNTPYVLVTAGDQQNYYGDLLNGDRLAALRAAVDAARGK